MTAEPSPFPGLRSAKKHRTREALLEATDSQLRAGARVRLAGVAAEAGVSEASLFNYFGSRDGLLGAWAHRSLATAFAAGVEGGGAGSLRGRLRPALREYARGLAAEAPELRAERAGALDRAPLSAVRDSYAVLESAVADAQVAGELRRDVHAASLVDAIVACASAALVRACNDGEGESAAVDLSRELQAAVDLVLDGARRRNERVRAGDARDVSRGS